MNEELPMAKTHGGILNAGIENLGLRIRFKFIEKLFEVVEKN